MFGQTFALHDLVLIGVLIVLEGVLSIDNALVLGLLARRLPEHLRSKALTYGLVGALVFRLVAVLMAAWLLQWRWVKLIGGLYLLWVAFKHFFFDKRRAERHDDASFDEQFMVSTHGNRDWTDYAHARSTHSKQFWVAVAAIELTDIAFAVDSIVAAIGIVGAGEPGKRHPKLWVVVVGGMLGVILMRFAAVMFIKLLEHFPRFEMSAYLLVSVIGAKLTADFAINTPEHPHVLNMHDPGDWAFWLFWGLMLACFIVGFVPGQAKKFKATDAHG